MNSTFFKKYFWKIVNVLILLVAVIVFLYNILGNNTRMKAITQESKNLLHRQNRKHAAKFDVIDSNFELNKDGKNRMVKRVVLYK